MRPAILEGRSGPAGQPMVEVDLGQFGIDLAIEGDDVVLTFIDGSRERWTLATGHDITPATDIIRLADGRVFVFIGILEDGEEE